MVKGRVVSEHERGSNPPATSLRRASRSLKELVYKYQITVP